MLAETRARLAERGGQPSQTVVNMLQAQLLSIKLMLKAKTRIRQENL